MLQVEAKIFKVDGHKVAKLKDGSFKIVPTYVTNIILPPVILKSQLRQISIKCKFKI